MTKSDASFSDETLNEAPAAATRLLGAIGAEPSIRTSLYLGGMTDEDIIEGRNLLLACLAAPSAPPAVTETEASRSQREAVVELDEWDEPNFARYHAALIRHFPAQARFVFENLSAARGVDAVRGVATFKARVEALRDGSDPNRTATRKEDRKAFELLEQRGLTAKHLKHLSSLIETALGPTPPVEQTRAAHDDARRKALLELKLWVNEWSAVARASIKKRGYLIRLGLVNRRRASKAPEEPSTPGTP